MGQPLSKSVFCFLVTGLLCCGPTLAAAEARDASPSFEHDIRPVVAANCVGCHNARKKKGDLDLSRFQTTQSATADQETWQDVADRLRTGDMPPKKATQRPTPDQIRLVLAWIDGHVAPAELDCEKLAKDAAAHPIEPISRRLTRAEYNNTVRDLFGVDFHLADLLPSDGAGGEGFDTDGDALFISALSIEKYLQAADRVTSALLPDRDTLLSWDLRSANEKLLVARPGPGLSAHDAARQVLAPLVRRAFRRPVGGEELDKYLSLFDKARKANRSYQASLKLAIKGVLISPNFLFLIEPSRGQEPVPTPTDFPLASRLSYFLWSSMPDEELFSLAEQGRLHDPEILRQQARRLIKDPRSVALAENFATQWLGIANFGQTKRPDPARFPEFTESLVDDEKREVVLFVDSIFREDRSLLDLLDARYTFANGRLAKLYDIPRVEGAEFRKVDLPDRNRGGVETMAATLTATSLPLRTSPVLRGKWVLEQLLGERIPPPPPGVPQLPSDDHKAGGLTFRQQLERHRADPGCAACHARMDPIGFGLENFDAIGRWRTTLSDEPIDARGVLPDGTRFSGPGQLREVLLKRKSDFLRNFSRKLLGYALGRGLSRYDQCVVNDAVKALEANGDRPGTLIETIILSAPFRQVYEKK